MRTVRLGGEPVVVALAAVVGFLAGIVLTLSWASSPSPWLSCAVAVLIAFDR